MRSSSIIIIFRDSIFIETIFFKNYFSKIAKDNFQFEPKFSTFFFEDYFAKNFEYANQFCYLLNL